MSAVIDIIVRGVGPVAVGWALGRWLLTADGLRGLTQVAFYSLFPALLFRSMAKVRLEALEPDIIVVFFGSGLLLYFLLMPLGRALGMKLGDQAVFALPAPSPTASASAFPSSPTRLGMLGGAP